MQSSSSGVQEQLLEEVAMMGQQLEEKDVGSWERRMFSGQARGNQNELS